MMRGVQLAKVAAQAEKLRLQRLARRQAFRAVFAVAASVFGLGALAWAHLIAWFPLRHAIGPIWASVVMTGFDLILALVLLLMAVHSEPDSIEQEAMMVRADALARMREDVIIWPLIGRVARLLPRKYVYGVTLAALTARYLGSRTR
ncbi:MAG TPA: hypothetical protein VME92_02710 [Acetobacteraceae bacterium]|nr:hypothetical protein [Acetobacteraceae bacterium]